MAQFSMGIGSNEKVEAYLYRLTQQLEYMFSHLSPEDNFDENARLIYVTNGERQTAMELSLEGISLSMVDKDNVVSAINLSKEGVKIQGDKITLEGVITANSDFRITLDGSMEARNGTFQGDISASNITGSTVTGGTITAGGADDGVIIVKNASGTEIGRWSKNGISVKEGSIEGTSVALGGSGNTGKITVKDATGNTIGTWDNNGIDVKAGTLAGTTINGSTINVGGSDTAGTIIVKDASNNQIGSWTKTGLSVSKGSLSGTSIAIGGSGTAGTITVKDGSNNTIGSWGTGGISVTKGSVSGTALELGGSGNTGKITVKDSNGNTIGTWDNTGLSVKRGSIEGISLTLGGQNNSYGTLTIKNGSGTTIGSWNNTGISVTGGSITGGQINGGSINGSSINIGGSGTTGSIIVKDRHNNTIGSWDRDGIDITSGEISVGQFYTSDNYTSIGPFQVTNNSLLEGYYCLATDDMSVGISSDPDESSNHWIWAGYDGGTGGASSFDFFVEKGGNVWAEDFCIIGENKTLQELINDTDSIYDDLNDLFTRVSDLEDAVFG